MSIAGLKFADSCVVKIWKDGTIEVNKEGVLATDSKGSEFKSCRVSIGARDVVVMMKWVSGLAKRLRHEEPLQNVENVHVLCPGESKTVALDEDEEATFRFSLPQFGKCEFRISTDSVTPIELKTGPVVFSISKSQPFGLLVEHAEGKDLTPLKVCNVTGRKTPAFMAELGSLSASEGMSIPVMIRGTLRNLRQLKDECFDLSKAYLQIVAWSEDEKAVIRTTSRGTAILVSDFPKVPFPADGTFEFQVLQLKPGRKYVLAAQEIVKPHDRTIGPLLVYTYDPPSGKLVEIEIDPAHAKTGKEQKLVIELGEICIPPRRDENGWQIPESAYE